MTLRIHFPLMPLSRLLFAALLLSPAWLHAESEIQGAALPKGTLLEEKGGEVENLAWKVGRGTLKMQKAVATAIQDKGQTVGIFLKGAGVLEYTSEFEPEFPVMAFNQKQNQGPKIEGAGPTRTLSIPVSDVSIFNFGVAGPALPSAASVSPSEAYRQHREFFDLLDSHPLGLLVADRNINQPSAPLVRMECRKEDQAFIYQLDGISGTESIVSVKKDLFGGIARLKEWLISSQPIQGRHTLYSPTPLVLTHLDLNIRATSNTYAKITAEETVQSVQPRRLLLLNQISEMVDWKSISPARNAIRVTAVKGPDGTPLTYCHRDDQIAVLLPSVLEAGQRIKLTFEIEGELLQQHRGDDYWELGLFPWFPWPATDGLNFTLHAKVRLPKPYVPVMSGETVRRAEEDGFNELETRLDKPVGWIALSGGKYTLKEYSRDGITVRLAGYAGLGVSTERLAKTALGIIGYYQTLLGPFPFKELNLIERKEWGQGQAPAGMVWISQEAFDPLGDTVNRILASMWINQGLAHEIAHQYWGIRLKMASDEDQWLTESFAEYASALAMLAMKGKEGEKYEQIVQKWRDRAKIASPAAPIALANRLAPAEQDEETGRYRQDILYFKGACLLHALHQDLGDAAFRKWLWLLQSNLGFKAPVNTVTLVPFLNYVSKREFGPYLDRYYWKTELPPFSKEILPPQGK